jgi:BirA family biotin operon repressor/biotin-[acetyl-CoA-carboxylase] ligase
MKARAAFPDFSLRHLARTSSTQDVVRRAAMAGAREGFCCVADEQSAGRGRQGRSWSAPPGTALLASLLLRRRPPAVAGIPFAAGLAAADALAESGIDARLKWPNDLMIGARKLGGILCEVEPRASALDLIAVAVGVGVNLRVRSFPADAGGVSAHELVKPPDPMDLLHAWVQAFGLRLEMLQRAGVAGLRDDWCSKATGLGDEVRAVARNGESTGIAEGIDDDGALLIRTASGMVRVLAADVHIAPARD